LIRIALDAMGGDHAPFEIIKGACEALNEAPVSIILVGNKEKLSKIKNIGRFEVVNATETIEMDESPVLAVKQKKDSSINVAMGLLKENKVDAVISAGNTGAIMASALFKLGRIEGIERPAIATIFPTAKGEEILLLDMGANVDCKPKNLRQFAIMGSQYAEHVMHINNPRIGLLNIGEEIEKGNELTSEAYPLLKESKINFIGHIEGGGILTGKADVVICDGFIGNVILKFGESISHLVFNLLKDEIKKNPVSILGALLLKPAFSSMRKKIDYDEFGAAPILGVNGIVFKAHGSAKSKAIKNAIKTCAEAVKENIVESISKGL
jgi:glycerol-3-phosphate acyltransferase PlsX